jgi:sarcosine oxidase
MSPEVAVVGAGIIGLSTAYALHERGVPVRVYERGVPGNEQSGGESRIFRHAHDDPRLVRLAIQSRGIWQEWSERLGVELLSSDGAIAIGPPAERRLAVLRQVGGVPARRISGDELAARLPLLAPYDGPVIFDEAGGAIRTGATIRALVGALGDALVADEVIALRPTGSGVEVRAGGACAEFSSVVVCAGRGTARFARGVGLTIPVTLAAGVRLTFELRGAVPERLPCLQDGGALGEAGVYATAQPGNSRYAVGVSGSVDVHEDGSLVDPAALVSLTDRAIGYVRRALPGLAPDPVEYRHCYLTHLPWSHDGFAAWEHDRIVFVAGHNLYKHAPALGRHLARAALGGGLRSDIRSEARLGEPG